MRALGPLVLVLLAGRAPAQTGPSEYDLKAAFVNQFLSYVTWPETKATAGDSVLVGVVGAEELAANLSMLAASAELIGRIDVRVLSVDADPRDLHVLFVAEGLEQQAAELLRVAVENSVLTVTESAPRSPDAVINFEIIDNKVRFDVALGLARRNGLEISARLLRVALRVLEEP